MYFKNQGHNLKLENLFIHHLWHNSNARRECIRLGRNEL